MLGGCAPVSVRCSWNARSSSAVAASGERPRKIASLLTARIYSRCVSGTNLRMFMSSSMRWRSGLMGFSLIGGSCLEVGVLEPLDPQDGAPARHLRPVQMVTTVDPMHPTARPAPSRESGFVLWRKAAFETCEHLSSLLSLAGPRTRR